MLCIKLPQLAIAHDRYLVVCILLVPSHVGLAANELVDNLAKIVCALEITDLQKNYIFRISYLNSELQKC